MNIYAKLTLLCVVLVVITSSIVYFLVNMELEQAFGAEAIQAMANDSGTIATTVQSTIDEIQSKLIWTILAVIVGSIALALVVANMFVKPILTITRAAESIAAGDLEAEIPVNSNDELGKLAENLNRASKGLISRLSEQRKLNETLEAQKDEIHIQKQK
ncbi:HAMP domain-containing protein [Marinoscillum sp.]|uniref:HAMP domain-containing protein n=1 Tax=Marinoscillum sp. TaxID=2024838 RepID=UPI003BA868D1